MLPIIVSAIALFFLLIFAAVLAFGGLIVRYFPIWLEMRAASVPFGWTSILAMHFQKLPIDQVANSLKSLHKAGVEVTARDLATHLLSGGMLTKVSAAAIAVKKAGLAFGFKELAAIDLAGRDVLDAINSHVNPKVLSCPESGRGGGLTGVAKDGVQVSVKARITVRTRLDSLVGNAGESTVLARVGEGIVAAIGRAESHHELLEHPEIITNAILAKRLDENTCFEIVSVDICDIDILNNVAAELRSHQADTDKRIARAQAEERRAQAVAQQQEMRARTMNAEVKVEEAKKVLPQGIARAFARPRLGRSRPWRMFGPHRMFWS